MPIDPKDELKSLLRELFQLDKTDLDFGIYRIMNLRAADVEDFIDNKLPATLKTVTDKLANKSKDEASAQVEEAKAKLKSFIEMSGEMAETNDELNAFADKMPNAPVVKKYLEAKAAVSSVSHSADLERDIYNDLYRFFNRYYDEGDFITKPRAGEHTYMIPYNGEEVKFYWANRDQYYIKTGENFRNYVFTNEETDAKAKVTVEFRLLDAETATNNNQNKKGRVFIPTEDYFDWNEGERKLTIKFYYKVPNDAEKETWGDKQTVKTDNKGINEKLAFKTLDEQIRATNDAHLIRFWEMEKTIRVKNKDEAISNFYYHLNRYTTTNSFDYFIHKDLRGFLMQELDYFLKHEIFSLNFIAPDFTDEQTGKAIKENILRASAIRSVAVAVIEFLAELENFQKMLFEKKKFVVQSDYCITLDLVPADVIDEVIEYVRTDGEQKQLLEWQKLGFIDALDLDAERIKADKYLVLDTQFLPAELKFKLLGGIEDLDEKCDGLLVNSDNFQGLNFLRDKYKNKIESVYSDPPYNAKSSEIIYKNNYKHSSWISMMADRLHLAASFKSKGGAIITAIDENEMVNLYKLLSDMFSDWENDCISIVHNPAGVQGDNFSYSHEYAIYSFEKQKNLIGKVERAEESEESFRDWGGTSARSLAKNCFYPIIVEDGEIVGFGDVCPDDFHPESSNIIEENKIYVYPVANDGEERKWVFARDSVEEIKDQLNVKEKDGKIRITRTKLITSYKTVWIGDKYYANIYGSKLLNNIFGRKVFDFPKSIYTVMECINAVDSFRKNYSTCLDYFAGSGTTGHAVIKLNREEIKKANENNLSNEDVIKRKYILVEMGEYFDTVTKPRIQKVVYSADWKSGKPVRNDAPLLDGENGMSNGISHIFQYIKLEQYEDSLNNIQFDEAAAAKKLVFTDQIKYILQKGTRDSASLLSIGKLANPFNYEMEIIRLNERRLTKIDLVTTFNFLLGIDVARYRVLEHQGNSYHVIHGKRGQQAFIIIWRHWTDALDMASERAWITAQDWYSEDAEIYTNADNAFKAKSIEAEFKKLMFA